MKKPFKFNELSPDRKCRKCGKPLKKNVLAKHPDADLCWKHHREEVLAGRR
jgi:hypothetical protein